MGCQTVTARCMISREFYVYKLTVGSAVECLATSGFDFLACNRTIGSSLRCSLAQVHAFAVLVLVPASSLRAVLAMQAVLFKVKRFVKNGNLHRT